MRTIPIIGSQCVFLIRLILRILIKIIIISHWLSKLNLTYLFSAARNLSEILWILHSMKASSGGNMLSFNFRDLFHSMKSQILVAGASTQKIWPTSLSAKNVRFILAALISIWIGGTLAKLLLIFLLIRQI